MRTASICPTCAIYENAKCILYGGESLPNIDITTLDSLEKALININTTFDGVVYKATNQNITGEKQFNPDTLAIKNLTNGEIVSFSYSEENNSSKIIIPIGAYDGSEYVGTLIYKELLPKFFVASISQNTGVQNEPTINYILKNDFAGTISLGYNNPGEFIVNNTLPEFTNLKTSIQVTSSGSAPKFLGGEYDTPTNLNFYSANLAGDRADDLLSNDLLIITVYP